MIRRAVVAEGWLGPLLRLAIPESKEMYVLRTKIDTLSSRVGTQLRCMSTEDGSNPEKESQADEKTATNDQKNSIDKGTLASTDDITAQEKVHNPRKSHQRPSGPAGEGPHPSRPPLDTSRRPAGKKHKLSKSLQSAQERLAELMSPGKDTLLLHEGSRYDLLGKAEDAPKVVAGASARAQEISPRRIHPHRLFYPGATYSPEDLNPYKAKEVLMRSDLTVRRGSIPTSVVLDQCDFRNREFLSYFVRESGKLIPRRRTHLPAKVHRDLMREIKLARNLGLMNPLSKAYTQKQKR